MSPDVGLDTTTTDGLAVDRWSPVGADRADRSAPAPAVTKVKLYLSGAGLFVHVTFDGVGPLLMRYDTGSPEVLLDKHEAEKLAVSEGLHDAEIDGYPMGAHHVFLYDLAEAGAQYPGLPAEPVRGIVGNGFFARHAVGLFRDKELWLHKTAGTGLGAAQPPGTQPAVVVPMENALGYLVVPCSFDDSPPTRNCLFDTGGITNMSFESYWAKVPHPSDRIVPGPTYDALGNPEVGYYQRAKASRIGPVRIGGDFVFVMKSLPPLQGVAQYIKKDLVGLVGPANIFGYHTIIDYGNQRLLLCAYDDQSHVPPSPFIGFGLVVEAMSVWAVVPQSQAVAAGVKKNDVVVAVDNVPAAMIPTNLAMIIPAAVGQTRRFSLLRQGSDVLELDVMAEDLLPPIP